MAIFKKPIYEYRQSERKEYDSATPAKTNGAKVLYIFDWDGTISDSSDRIVTCMQLAAQDLGIEALEPQAIKNIIGLGLPEAISSLYPSCSHQQICLIQERYAHHFIQKDTMPSDFFPGVMDTLQTLLDRGHHLAVATGKSRRGLERVWRNLGLEDFFHGSRCADETASKPDPLMLSQLLQEFSVAADKAVLIGDTEYDMAMAAALGMPKIAVSFGVHSLERLNKFNPEMCVDHFSEILSWPEYQSDR